MSFDWVVPTGEFVQEWMEDAGLSARVMATACQLDVDVLERIIDGTEPVTEDIARRLEAATGVSARMWLRLEEMYRAGP